MLMVMMMLLLLLVMMLMLLLVLRVRLLIGLLLLLLTLQLRCGLALLAGERLHRIRLLFLPHEDVMDHGASAKHDAEADEDRRDDRRCRMELDECVQNHAG